MADTAADLVACVLPEVPVRQVSSTVSRDCSDTARIRA